VRWPSKTALKPREGEERMVRKFLWWPRSFGGEKRWMEWCNIVEMVLRIDVGGSMEWGNYAWRWCETGFADQEAPEGCAAVVERERKRKQRGKA